MADHAEYLEQRANKPSSSGAVQARDYSFIVLINAGSGTVSSAEIKAALTQSNRQLNIEEVLTIEGSDSIDEQFEQAFLKARLNKAAVLVVGGDGSQCLGVKYALANQIPLAILPQGTFNLFALHHGIPTDLEQAIESLESSRLNHVAVSWVNQQPFLTGVQFGLYVDIIKQRERHQAMTGVRSRLTAYLSGVYTFLFKSRKLNVKVLADSDLINVNGQVMMLSHNRPHLEHLGLQRRSTMLDSKLMLAVAKPKSIWDKFRLLRHRLQGRLEEDFQFEDRLLSDAVIHCGKKTLEAVVDGEIMALDTPLKIKIQPRALALFKPA